MLIKNYLKTFKINKKSKIILYWLALPLVLSIALFNIFFLNSSRVSVIPSDYSSYQNPNIGVNETELQALNKLGTDFKPVFYDYRAFVLDKYFALNKSPLAGYGAEFIAACDKYGAPSDCTTIPAIAYVETGLCTLGLSQVQHNCWGWGGSGENRILFKSYSESIDAVTKGVVKGYSRVINRPEIMYIRYCGAHCNNWATGVKNEKNKINNMAKQLSLPSMF